MWKICLCHSLSADTVCRQNFCQYSNIAVFTLPFLLDSVSNLLFCARKTEQQEIESIRNKIIFGCIIVFLAIQAVIALNFGS